MGKKSKKSGLTKQGVRNLDHLPSKSVGIRLPEPPKQASLPMICYHLSGDDYGYCRACGEFMG